MFYVLLLFWLGLAFIFDSRRTPFLYGVWWIDEEEAF